MRYLLSDQRKTKMTLKRSAGGREQKGIHVERPSVPHSAVMSHANMPRELSVPGGKTSFPVPFYSDTSDGFSSLRSN